MKPIAVLSTAAVALAACAALFSATSAAGPAVAATPPPTPPPIDAAQPAPAPTPIPVSPEPGLPATASPSPNPYGSPTPTPPPDARKGVEGVWELQIQRGDKTEYSHFKLLQSGNTLSGTFLDTAGKKYPLAGSVDGRAIRIIVSMPDGTTTLLEGRLDGTTDMLGMLTTAKEQVPFTAAYRPKEKWIDNVNASPGGLGSGGGGGYTPP